MGLFQKLIGYTTGNGVEVDANHQLLVGLPNDSALVGQVLAMAQNDDGTYTGEEFYMSGEVDKDYRQRCGLDTIMDEETFNYATNNRTKFTTYAAATNYAPSFTTSGYNTNPTSVLTAASAMSYATYAHFTQPSTGTLSLDMELAFSANPQANVTIEFGLFAGAVATPFAPTDGVFFRLNSSGLQGIASYNTVEATTDIFHAIGATGQFAYTIGKKYQFIIYITNVEAEFWIGIDGEAFLLGSIPVPQGQGTLTLGTSFPVHIVQRTGATAGGAISATVSRYSVRQGGVFASSNPAEYASRALGSYVTLSGASPASLMGNTITSGSIANPTAAALTNTTNASGVTGLGCLTWETPGLAFGTDGIVWSYQVPAATTALQGRRLKISGISLTSTVQTVIGGGPWTAAYMLAFGGTSVTLAATESDFVKLARRIRLPFVQQVTVNQAVNTTIAQNIVDYKFTNPVYVNPGEWVQLICQKWGTIGAGTGTIAHITAVDYSWE